MCLIAVATLGTACGSSSTGRSTSTLAKKDSVSFRGLPQFEGSTPVGQPDVQGSATTQTFTVNNASPHEILQFYAESLGDWTVLEEPHALGSGAQSAWRGRWRGGTATLLVSAAHTPSPNQKATQYSLDLRDS